MIGLNLPKFREKDFEKHYSALTKPAEQIQALSEWRAYQIDTVSKFIENIRQMAQDLYTDVDHFFLELLQNADDNEYDPNSSPTVMIELQHDAFILRNNESGFGSDDLYSITYTSSSTKLRKKTSQTFIGEKGIGFKSVFAVAEHVDIHSGHYDFRLKNEEYIIPHQLPPRNIKGTEIRITFRKDLNIHELLSRRLTDLHKNAQEFILFLQKIEKLVVDDAVSGTVAEVTTQRSAERNYFLVQTHDSLREFFSFKRTEIIPNKVVLSRFKADDLPEPSANIDREIIFAVPYPGEDGINTSGKLFCYLPTDVMTGTPIHIQVDAKTITNRQNIAEFANNPWNKEVFKNFVGHMCDLYEEMTKNMQFKATLPLYWPFDIERRNLGNKDIQQLMIQVKTELSNRDIILDRHGNFFKPLFLRTVPDNLGDILYEDKYEKALSRYVCESEDLEVEGYDSADLITLVDKGWSEQFKNQLQALSVKEITPEECVEMLLQGVPASLKRSDPGVVRNFMTMIMEFADRTYRKSHDWQSFVKAIKNCKIFPVITNKTKSWGALSSETRWLKTTSPEAKGIFTISIIDPQFTYTPGGSRGTEADDRDEVRDFNRRFRDFLSDVLDVKSINAFELFGRNAIKELQKTTVDPNKKAERENLNQIWHTLYNQVWRRKTAILKEENEKYWSQLLEDISKCKIPCRMAGEKKWILTSLSQAYIGPQFLRQPWDLNKEYSGTGAPIIFLDSIQEVAKKMRAKRDQSINTSDWAEFLTKCSARSCPMVVTYSLSKESFAYYNFSYYGTSSAYKSGSTLLATGILESIRKHPQFLAERETGFRVDCSESSTYGLDSFSAKLVNSGSSDMLAITLSQQWQIISRRSSDIQFIWGSKQVNRYVSTRVLHLYDQIKTGILVQSDRGLLNSSHCFEDNQFNRNILGSLVPYVTVAAKGYNQDLLVKAGMIQNVQANHIEALIRKWYDQSENRSSASFFPYLRAFQQFCAIQQDLVPTMRTQVPLYCESQDCLLIYDEWVHCITVEEYPVETVDELSFIMKGGRQVGLDKALEILCRIGVSEDNCDAFHNALVEIGRACRNEDYGNIRDEFNEKLNTFGFNCFGTEISAREEIPVLWDAAALPIDRTGIIPVPGHYHINHDYILAVNALGWPQISKIASLSESIESMKQLDDVSIRCVYSVIREVTGSWSKESPQCKQQLDRLGIFFSQSTITSKIRKSNNESLSLHAGQIMHQVPYWFDEGMLCISACASMDKVIPHFVDWHCGSTLTCLFGYVWQAREIICRNYESDDSGDKSQDWSKPKPPTEGFDGGGSSASEGNVGGLGDDDDDDSTSGEEKKGKPTGNAGGEDKFARRKRSRLGSLVAPLRNKKTTSEDDEKNAEEEKRRKAVEQKGVEHLYTVLSKIGVSHDNVKDVQADKVGYDFEVKVGDVSILIELKASGDKWNEWEQALTKNEFQKAREVAERAAQGEKVYYFLCVIDGVFEDDWEYYFIKDPAGEVDEFYFDSPWKAFSTKFDTFLARLRSDRGILED